MSLNLSIYDNFDKEISFASETVWKSIVEFEEIYVAKTVGFATTPEAC